MRLVLDCESGSLVIEYDPRTAEAVDATALDAMSWVFDDLIGAETVSRRECDVHGLVLHDPNLGTPESDTLLWLSDHADAITIMTMEDGTVMVQSITGDFGIRATTDDEEKSR
jgi:hypothetical protein